MRSPHLFLRRLLVAAALFLAASLGPAMVATPAKAADGEAAIYPDSRTLRVAEVAARL